ncbi:hypothetical protein CRE_30841 [Caenorhabditis remanei]|uniref:Uncharacterized protein n=1 Tax=Caenorhabditis remanei TaxID=31234 RepID=E3LUK3_CAERE|nr:hypothetical protein CRE_30841 [Caenorhabditis remanei]
MHFFCDLPYVAARTLFQFFDYGTRMSLQACSKRIGKLEGIMPLYIDVLKISTDLFSIKIWQDFAGSQIQYNFPNHIYNALKEAFWGLFYKVDEKTIEETMSKLGGIFQNKNLRVKRMIVSLLWEFPIVEQVIEDQIYLVSALSKMMLASLDRQVLVEDFTIRYRGNQDEVMCFLPFLKPDASLDRIVNLPQMVKAREVWFRSLPRFRTYMESFWNIPKVNLWQVELTFYEVNQLVQHYFQHDNFEYLAVVGVSDDWFPNDSTTFMDEENRKAMTLRGPRFGIKFVQKLEKNAIVLTRVP